MCQVKNVQRIVHYSLGESKRGSETNICKCSGVNLFFMFSIEAVNCSSHLGGKKLCSFHNIVLIFIRDKLYVKSREMAT